MTDAATPDAPPPPWSHPGVLIATGFGVGYLKPGPGTWGSLLGLAMAWAFTLMPTYAALLLWVLSLPLATWACGVGTRHFGRSDPGGVVVDEIVAVPIAVAGPLAAGATPGWPVFAAAFLAFRVLDIVKPWPVSAAERVPGARGVMADDLVAGALAAFTLALLWLVF